MAVICEGQCDNYAGEPVFPEFRPETVQAVVGTPRYTQPPTETVPVVDDAIFYISIVGGEENELTLSIPTADLDATQLEIFNDAVWLLSSEGEQDRAIGMEKLFKILSFPDKYGMITLENLTFESFTQKAEFRLHLSETVSTTVKSVEVVLAETVLLRDPTWAECKLFAEFYLGELRIGQEQEMTLTQGPGDGFGSFKFKLAQDLVDNQDDAANDPAKSDSEFESTLRMDIRTAASSEGADASCRIDWGDAATNERGVVLLQEEGAANYSFDPDTGVARFTDIAVRSTLDPAHIVVYNKTGPIDNNGQPTERDLYPEWVDPELMEETLEILVVAAETMLQKQASEVRISFGRQSPLKDFNPSEVATASLIRRAVVPTEGSVGIDALENNLSETRDALEGGIQSIVVLGRTGLNNGVDYCEDVPNALSDIAIPAILVDFAPASALDAMEDRKLKASFTDGVPDRLVQINRRLPIVKCPSVDESQLKHWVIFVDDKSSRGYRQSLKDFANYLFED